MPQEIIIYSSAYCWYCNRAKKIFTKLDLVYREIRIDLVEEERIKLMEMCGQMTVPQIFIGEHHVGGCDDLEALITQDGLESIIELQGILSAKEET